MICVPRNTEVNLGTEVSMACMLDTSWVSHIEKPNPESQTHWVEECLESQTV